jgi:hypothetical protein
MKNPPPEDLRMSIWRADARMRTDTSGAVEMLRMRHFRLPSEILRRHQLGGVCGRNIMAPPPDARHGIFVKISNERQKQGRPLAFCNGKSG